MAEMSITTPAIGTTLKAEFSANMLHSTSAGAISVAFSLDGAAEVGGGVFQAAFANHQGVIGFHKLFTGLTPGQSYNIKVRWSQNVSGGSTTGLSRSFTVTP